MLKELLVRHRALRVAATVLGASALAVGFASPAFASQTSGGNTSSVNTNIVLGGSNTTYLMMTALSNIFNESPGCDLATGSGTQPLDYECPGVTGSPTQGTNQSTGTTAVGENGFTPFATENPFNDVLIQEPAIGSSNGVAELELQGAHGTATFTGDVTTLSGSAVICTPTGFPGAQSGDTITDSGGDFPATTVSSLGGTNASCTTTGDDLTLATTATGTSTTDSVTTVAKQHAAPLDAARSSRAPNLTGASAGDDKGLNFVAYAMDGVSWLHWTKAPPTVSPANNTAAPVATPSANVKDLTVAQLTSIYNGTLSCSAGTPPSTVTENWACVGGADAPIDVYMAQCGSGTESTWATLLGLFVSPAAACPGTFPASHVIFENETGSIFQNGDEANAIFFFSYGKFNTTCPGTPAAGTTPAGAAGSAGYCGSAPTGLQPGSSLSLGTINGIAASPTTIANQLPGTPGCTTIPGNVLTAASAVVKPVSGTPYTASLLDDTVTDTTTPGNLPADTTVKKFKSTGKLKLNNDATAASAPTTGDTLVFCPSVFPGDRLLYNVYSDGSNPDIPQSSSATLNAISEDGFLCKAATNVDVDPNTGNTYLSEIQATIKAQGFFPLAAAGSPIVEDGNTSTTPPFTSTASGIPNPAWTTAPNALDAGPYSSTAEQAAPYSFPAADTDTDGLGGGTATNPKGYCLVLSTDGNSTN
jgi:hypothetical protein